MPCAAVASAVSAVITAGKLVAEQGSGLCGVEEQVDSLQEDLEWMKDFLANEADDGKNHRQADKIRELAYDAEDVLETFNLKVVSRRKPGFTNYIKRYACILHEGWMLYKTRSEIDKIIAKSAALNQRKKKFPRNKTSGGGEGSSSSTTIQEQRRPYQNVIDKNIVGLDGDIKKLVAILVDEGSECKVVSISGTGGLGKTTLAKKIFQHPKITARDFNQHEETTADFDQHEEITAHFQHSAFVYVSKRFQTEEVWKDILSKLKSSSTEESDILSKLISSSTEENNEETLRKFMKDNKCLVILDDIWDVQAWNSLKHAFPLERNSKSKILLTSRFKDIVPDADGVYYRHELPRLTDDESWELFEKITSPLTASPGYTELGKKMVQRCPKLPLAIVALGGILAKKKLLVEWREVSRNSKSYFRERVNEKESLEQALTLSYDYLPHHLRSCFLYLSQFPEDYEIETQRLIQLLVAEGIVSPEKEGEIAEDVAEGYLVELAERYMIQPRGIDPVTSKMTTFQLHDEMRFVCLLKAKQEEFAFIVDESNACSLSPIRKVRRISAHKFFETQLIECPNLRSLSFYNTRDLGELFHVETPDACIRGPVSFLYCFGYDLTKYLRFLKARGFWVHIFTNLKLLRVLNYEGRGTAYAECKLIGDIENLIHLRFLSLRNVEFDGSKLPSSLGNLICLQTLDLRVNVNAMDLIHVPDVIWRMEQLRHLYLPYRFKSKTKLKLHTLRNLQTLVNFNTDNCYLKDLINMTNLRKLEIFGPFKIEDFNESDLTFEYLHTLSICSLLEGIDPRHLNRLLSSCGSICKLRLIGKISKLPELCYRSLNLACIHLRRCHLEEDPMPTLEKLPNLRFLELYESTFPGRKMVCSAGGFPKLESLSLMYLVRLEYWKVDEGAMPFLKRLWVQDCPKLNMIPIRQRYHRILIEY